MIDQFYLTHKSQQGLVRLPVTQNLVKSTAYYWREKLARSTITTIIMKKEEEEEEEEEEEKKEEKKEGEE